MEDWPDWIGMGECLPLRPAYSQEGLLKKRYMLPDLGTRQRIEASQRLFCFCVCVCGVAVHLLRDQKE